MSLKKYSNVINLQKSNEQTPVVLVTGGARRLGKELVKALHAANYRVIIHYRFSKGDAEALCQDLNHLRENSAALVEANFVEISEIIACGEKAAAIWGRIDVVINNASSFFPTKVGETTPAQWQELLNSNVMAPYFLVQSVLPFLQSQQSHVINIADIHGQKPLKGYAVYSTAKAALIMLTKALARELGPLIQVNAIAPGIILWSDDHPPSLADRKNLTNRTVLKKIASVKDIIQTIFFLLSQSSITGEVINVDCGRLLK